MLSFENEIVWDWEELSRVGRDVFGLDEVSRTGKRCFKGQVRAVNKLPSYEIKYLIKTVHRGEIFTIRALFALNPLNKS